MRIKGNARRDHANVSLFEAATHAPVANAHASADDPGRVRRREEAAPGQGVDECQTRFLSADDTSKVSKTRRKAGLR
jgi:hypothetical protein